ncbi:MAG: glycosyl transferase, group 2 family [Firmicutes bacterium]|nr:glycosyl transferase, group 2 family [Bacillota bacterium]
MNPNKICFITCVNDEEVYQESLFYINRLVIPEGFAIETIKIKNANCITKAYNSALQSSDAKYKVYLHQDVFIINKNFLTASIDLFLNYPNLGMLGVTGSTQVPTNGVWLESRKNYGKGYDSHSGKLQLLSFHEVSGEYQSVQVVDGAILITQYDIPWRDDIFTGWHFYDLSHSLEFIRAGLQIGIPRQIEPWCIHDNRVPNTSNGLEAYKRIFLEEYSKDIFPLVSILIPTYNRPDYFKLALDSAVNQTYKNIEIIVGDDSTDNRTENLVQKEYLGHYNNIVYYHNKKNLGQFDNDLKLFAMAKGEYINYLMDDDLFQLTKIEKMMNYFVFDDSKKLSLVTSNRMIIDETGRDKGIFANADKIFKADTWITGEEVVTAMLLQSFNFIGEPTTVLFRKAALTEPFGTFAGRRYGCNVDQASWFNLLENGNVVYIAEVLSYFRVHSAQQLQSNKMKLLGACDSAHTVLTTRYKGVLKDNNHFKSALQNCINYCHWVKTELQQSESIQEYHNEWTEFENWCRNLSAQYDLLLQAE